MKNAKMKHVRREFKAKDRQARPFTVNLSAADKREWNRFVRGVAYQPLRGDG